MRWRTRAALLAAVAMAAVAAVAQQAPESILPPGFGRPTSPPPRARPAEPDEPVGPTRRPARATEARPSEPRQGARPSATSQAGPATAETASKPATPAEPDVPEVALATPTDGGGDSGEVVETPVDQAEAGNAGAAPDVLPAYARRALSPLGLLDSTDGGLGDATWGRTNGVFLRSIMDAMAAPIASRWASILLRRALLSAAPTPVEVGGADWAAARASLLARMGEADMARALVARVDAEDYTPALDRAAMDAALAAADPGALCPVADDAAGRERDRQWAVAQGICAGLSGEGGSAGAVVGRGRDGGPGTAIDGLLAEKVIGSGSATRRAINIQWDGVDQLTPWRFGLAAATGVPLPPPLLASANPAIVAWYARAPLYPLADRLSAMDAAAAMGVISSASLVDAYAAAWEAADPSERSTLAGDRLRAAYTAGTVEGRLDALHALWGDDDALPYGRAILTARVSQGVPAGGATGRDADRLVAAMLSAGLDTQAARWSGRFEPKALGWALLAVGAPQPQSGVTVAAAREGGDARARLLVAALAGLGRLSDGEARAAATELGAPIDGQTSWTRAVDAAAAAGEPGTVALLAAAGLQSRSWTGVPPLHLYHITAALRRVGLEPEARMIAAEAIARAT